MVISADMGWITRRVKFVYEASVQHFPVVLLSLPKSCYLSLPLIAFVTVILSLIKMMYKTALAFASFLAAASGKSNRYQEPIHSLCCRIIAD